MICHCSTRCHLIAKRGKSIRQTAWELVERAAGYFLGNARTRLAERATPMMECAEVYLDIVRPQSAQRYQEPVDQAPPALQQLLDRFFQGQGINVRASAQPKSTRGR